MIKGYYDHESSILFVVSNCSLRLLTANTQQNYEKQQQQEEQEEEKQQQQHQQQQQQEQEQEQ